MNSGTVSLILKSLVLFTAYFFTAKLGLMHGSVSTFATLVWPPTGIALAAIVLGGYRLWPALFLSAFFINLHTGAPFLSALGIGFGNTAEALLGAYLLQKNQFSPRLDRLKDVFGLIFLAAILSTLVSATIGVSALWLNGLILPDTILITWRTWWIGDMLGNLVVAPFILVWVTRSKFTFAGAKFLEVAALVCILTTVCLLVFHETSWNGGGNYSVLYAIFPLITWAAVRFNALGAVTAIFWVSVITIWSTIEGIGPFAGPHLSTNLFFLQTFQGTLAVSGLILAAAMSERSHSLKQAQLALQSRDEFLSIASHELKTPVTLLYLNLQVILRMKTHLPEETVKSISSAERAASRLVNLLNKLLDLTKVQAGKLTLERETIDLYELTETIAVLFSEDARQVGSSLTLKKPDRLIKGKWDRQRIEQVITNLISNALKYGSGKPILIEISDADSDETKAQIRVTDQGLGISPEMTTKIFERFERVNESSTIGGLGLGLYITRQIVTEHGGLIQVESELGKGSTFCVTLPTGY